MHNTLPLACWSLAGRAAFQFDGGGDGDGDGGGGGGDDGNGACNLLRLIAGGILLGVDFCRLCVWFPLFVCCN